MDSSICGSVNLSTLDLSDRLVKYQIKVGVEIINQFFFFRLDIPEKSDGTQTVGATPKAVLVGKHRYIVFYRQEV